MLKQKPHLIRERFVINKRIYNHVKIENTNILNFCSNDYLGMSSHPLVKNAFIQGVQLYGVGSGASALVSGFYRSHKMIEEQFAEFFQRDRAILFGSGYLANIGIIRALVNRHGAVLADKFCHVSILEGIQLSRAKCVRYLHNNVNHLKSLFAQSNNYQCLVTESVFSMEGDISPVKQIAEVVKKSNSLLMLDDAHGAGILGKHGRGITEYAELTQQDVPCLVVPLGKAFGLMGAIVAGGHDLIESIMQFAKTYCYSTALPPAIAHAAMTSLKIIEYENWRRLKLQELIQFFIVQAKQRNLPLVSNDLTPIKSILIEDIDIALKIKNELLKKHIFISCIRPPTVSKATTRIRISLNCMHQEKNIIDLLDCVATLYEKFKKTHE
jgi:8-amino-7-oxononanoate synthase